MTTKERILFGVLIGSLYAATIAGHILTREYDKLTDERDDVYAQIAYLLNIMAQNGIEVDIVNGIASVSTRDRDKT